MDDISKIKRFEENHHTSKDEKFQMLKTERNTPKIKLTKVNEAIQNGLNSKKNMQRNELLNELREALERELSEKNAREWEKIAKEKEKLHERENMVRKAEIERDHKFSDERTKLEQELSKLRIIQERELEERRKEFTENLEKELLKEAKLRRKLFNEQIEEELKEHKLEMFREKKENRDSKKEYNEKLAQLDFREQDLEYQKDRLNMSKENLEKRKANLQDEIADKMSAERALFEDQKSLMEEQIRSLRESIMTTSRLIANFEDLKLKLGDEDPASLLLKLKTYELEITNLREELTARPSREMEKAYERIVAERNQMHFKIDELSDENITLKRNLQLQREIEYQIDELSERNKSLEQRYESVNADNNRLMQELKRLNASYERESDREARIRDIERPYLEEELPRMTEEVDELQWLNSISDSCMNYGLQFPQRILYAFHTALKTAEWSPLTVLAGVSGTGKSELPRLYSHFGGINFLNLSVQPNWDSQESMLGFFNSLDNKFDAQPVLRLLAQSQKPVTAEYKYGLKDSMSLVLLDEMNLAHVELYFAEFLSKLELRRGQRGDKAPKIEVKLGAGMQQYDLTLGRNVLWAGTMNQDETTKSLSDKVLDRGIIINFPRPTILQRRMALKALGTPAPLLSRNVWEKWWCKESVFTEEHILPYKVFIEELNSHLSKVGRALGHRVWQSIEYYMCNYPLVLEAQRNEDETALVKAMKIAFEDQLVQKVMPKLRGIETRGKSKTECLDKILAQLKNDDYKIVEDFEFACEFGYGQFMWNSANYMAEILGEDDKVEVLQTDYEDIVQEVKEESDDFYSEEMEKLKVYAQGNSMEVWQMTKKDIKEVTGCDAKTAEKLKGIVNARKGK
jgi:NifU-like protein involved in Fe-S cluster formation